MTVNDFTDKPLKEHKYTSHILHFYFPRLPLILSMVLAVVTFIQNIEVITSIDKDYLFLVALTTLLLLIFILMKLQLSKISEKWMLVFLFIASFSCRLFFVLEVNTPISGDYLLIYNAAKDTISGGYEWLQKSFFSIWAYQLPFVYYEAFILKLFQSVLALKLLNVAFMTGTNILIYLLGKEIVPTKAAFFGAFLYAFYPAPVLLSSVLTNQHISLFFILLGIYYIIHNFNWKHMPLAALFLCLGNLMRPEGIIVIVAFVVWILFYIIRNFADKNYINIIRTSAVLVASYVLIMQLAALSFKMSGLAPHGIGNNCPEWKLVLGLDTESKGVYNEKNSHIFVIQDSSQRKKEARNIIENSIESYNPTFFWEKSKIMWGNMEIVSWSLSHIDNNRPLLGLQNKFTYEKAIQFVVYFEKSMYLLLILASIYTYIILWRNDNYKSFNAFFFILLIIINYFAYLFIEIQVRYRYFIMPAFFILITLAADGLTRKNKKIRA